MKKFLSLFAMIVFTFTSCSSDGEMGPPGPQGPPGEPGEPGAGVSGQTFEFEDVNFEYFSESNTYNTIIGIPEDIDVDVDDAVLVYILETIDDNGDVIETWSLIPQNYFLDEGTIQYVYNHTEVDVELIIDGNFDLSNLDEGYTQNQVFRFVVVPSDFIAESGVDASNYRAVMSVLKSNNKQ